MERHLVTMELRFSYRIGSVTYMGTGRIRNLSSQAVCFESDQDIRRGTELELRIPWAFQLQGICPLELVVTGQLVRKNGAVTVIRMKSYEFQTHGDRSFSQLASCGITCDLAA